MKKMLKHASPVSRAHMGIFVLVFAAIGAVVLWRSLAATNPNLPGDLNNDNTVNITDMSILLSNYGTSNASADINSDGTVNVLDMSILLSNYGKSVSGTTVPSNFGETNILSTDDSGNANLLVAQSASLSQNGTLQSLSFYISQAAGKLRLSIYNATGASGGPGTKLAETGEITPVVGWNKANVLSQVNLTAGTYWLAYLASDNNLHFVKTADGSSSSKLFAYTYGTMPATFSTTPNSSTSHWSLYATVNVASTGGGGTTNTTYKNFVGVVGPNLPLIVSKGVYNDRIDIGRLSKSSLDTARAAGESVIPLIAYNPYTDLRPAGTSDHYAPDTTARRITWAQREMQTVTSIYSTPPEALEVWNEPFLQSFWSQGPNAAQYLDLVHQFSLVAWATPGYANMKILVSCDSGWGGWCDNLIAVDTNNYLNDPRMFPTAHPYCNDRSPDYHSSTAQAQKDYDCDRYKFTYSAWKAHGAVDPKVWVTEFGWVSLTPGSQAIGNEGPGVSEQTQADYTVKFYKNALASGQVAKAYSYMLSNCSEIWSYNWIRPDCTDKPVISAVDNLIINGN